MAREQPDESVTVSFPQLQAEPPALTWEYLIGIAPASRLPLQELEDNLNVYGAQGWEIIAVHYPNSGHVLMKRPKWVDQK